MSLFDVDLHTTQRVNRSLIEGGAGGGGGG